jgi:hypothetical protein
MNHKEFSLRGVLASALVLALAWGGTASAQDERTGEPKGSGVSLQSVAVNNTLTAAQLAEVLVGSGVSTSNVTFTGHSSSSGSFSGGTGNVGLASGLVLASGQAVDATGPNTSDSTTTGFGTPGDNDLNTLIPGWNLTLNVRQVRMEKT